MSYAKFDKLIVLPYKVRIIGWPNDVPFCYPQKLAADEVRTLHESLMQGTTHWTRMTGSEHCAVARELEKADELSLQDRGQHSDAGKKHNNETDSEQPQQKKKSVSKGRKKHSTGDNEDSSLHGRKTRKETNKAKKLQKGKREKC